MGKGSAKDKKSGQTRGKSKVTINTDNDSVKAVEIPPFSVKG